MHYNSGVVSTAGQLLMLQTLATMAVSTTGTRVQAATPILSSICMDLLENEPTIGHIHVRRFRYSVEAPCCGVLAAELLVLISCCCFSKQAKLFLFRRF